MHIIDIAPLFLDSIYRVLGLVLYTLLAIGPPHIGVLTIRGSAVKSIGVAEVTLSGLKSTEIDKIDQESKEVQDRWK